MAIASSWTSSMRARRRRSAMPLRLRAFEELVRHGNPYEGLGHAIVPLHTELGPQEPVQLPQVVGAVSQHDPHDLEHRHLAAVVRRDNAVDGGWVRAPQVRRDID